MILTAFSRKWQPCLYFKKLLQPSYNPFFVSEHCRDHLLLWLACYDHLAFHSYLFFRKPLWLTSYTYVLSCDPCQVPVMMQPVSKWILLLAHSAHVISPQEYWTPQNGIICKSQRSTVLYLSSSFNELDFVTSCIKWHWPLLPRKRIWISKPL